MSERITCPKPDCGKTYASLSGLKTHMQRMHDGYTPEEIQQATASAQTEETPPTSEFSVVDVSDDGEVTDSTDYSAPPPPPSAPPEPKRVSKRSRDLNDQLNSAIQLGIKHLTKGLDDADKAQLDFYRNAVVTALIGFEFDFEERIITLRSKVWLLITVGLLYVVEKLPTFSTMFALLGEQRKKAKQATPAPSTAEGSDAAK
jgi:hypothetical protein